MPVPGQKGMVMEYGRASRQSSLAARNAIIEDTMANYNAVYTMIWKTGKDGLFYATDEYTLQSRKRFSFLNHYILMVLLCPSWMIFQSFSMHTAVFRALVIVRRTVLV